MLLGEKVNKKITTGCSINFYMMIIYCKNTKLCKAYNMIKIKIIQIHK